MIIQCPIIFTNVRNGFAPKTFEVSVIDNLLKPIINGGVERNVKKIQIFSAKNTTILIFFVILRLKTRMRKNNINHTFLLRNYDKCFFA